ncbi:MAG: OmpH family outer membrane protein [Acidobacteria bacterium]|nr:OmpH family outer membrane protein [Acidobacteriota bacterium]
MRRSILAFAALAIAIPAVAQQAQPATQSVIDKFAVLVPQRVIEQSGHCRKLFAGLELQRKQWQDKLEAKAGEGQAVQKQLQATGLSDEGKDRLQKQLRDLQYDFNKMQEDAKADMEKAQSKASGQFNQDVGPVLEEISKEKGLQAVIQYSPGLFAYLNEQAALSFSDEVAKRVDAKFPADANFQSQGAAKPAKK